ncbi:phosphatase PAP2 family protein [Nocardia higoensis]|uniref:phosphatase PAP2 family protein n=1 Tax=Nocardia higoensis TaxID=228599 RepID=UPI0006857FA9|nr:phosphatase PAP2 family protein [Nocardia higoensis]
MLGKRVGAPAVRAAAATAGALTVCLLPLTFPPGGGPTALDRAFADAVAAGPPSALDRLLVAPSDAPVVLAALLLAVGWFAWQRRWLAMVTMAVVPELALALNTWALKPLFDRPLEDYLAYPSGHTVHMVAVACAFVLLCDSRRAGWVIGAVAGVAVIAAAAGQVGMGYHHLTDVAGGAAAGLSITVVCCTAVELAASHPSDGHRTRRDAPVERPGGEHQER